MTKKIKPFWTRRFFWLALVAICGLSLEVKAAPNGKEVSAPAGMVWDSEAG